ncbi:hypothetical protein, partial [Aeromonas veronii]|uniref:hypothetical protein n=1 Tax=Aeromonas veronii TaxID=654 RepID=UPI00406CF885
GASGTAAMNACYYRIVSLGRTARPSRFVAGEPVVFLRNDYRRDLRSGSLGEVVSIETDGPVIAFFDGSEYRLTSRHLDNLDHAYPLSWA